MPCNFGHMFPPHAPHTTDVCPALPLSPSPPSSPSTQTAVPASLCPKFGSTHSARLPHHLPPQDTTKECAPLATPLSCAHLCFMPQPRFVHGTLTHNHMHAFLCTAHHPSSLPLPAIHSAPGSSHPAALSIVCLLPSVSCLPVLVAVLMSACVLCTLTLYPLPFFPPLSLPIPLSSPLPRPCPCHPHCLSLSPLLFTPLSYPCPQSSPSNRAGGSCMPPCVSRHASTCCACLPPPSDGFTLGRLPPFIISSPPYGHLIRPLMGIRIGLCRHLIRPVWASNPTRPFWAVNKLTDRKSVV